MSLYPIGVIIALSVFWAAIYELKQSVLNYYDFVAFFVVIGGTIAVFVILLPWNLRKEMKRGFRDLFLGHGINYRKVVTDCLEVIQNKGREVQGKSDYIHIQILKDGTEMIYLGIEKEKIISILNERLRQYIKRRKKVGNAIRSLSKYPPAFGLMGTVLGLVNVMRGVSNGIDGKQTALEMAIALVSTMYGLLVANLIVNPSGELIVKQSSDEEVFGEIAISAIELLANQFSLLEAQEVLNSYAPVEQRVNLMDSNFDEVAA